MKKFRHFFAVILIAYFSMSPVAQSASRNYDVENIFGILNSSAIHFTAASMDEKGLGRPYMQRVTLLGSNREVILAMAEDFVEKYKKGDKNFCITMLDFMIMGSRGYADIRAANHINLFKEELFGNQAQPKKKTILQKAK